MTTPTIALLILAKAPQAGRVKTRLCPPATPLQAARIAAAALLDTLSAVRSVPNSRPVVALTGDLAHAERHSELTSALRGISIIPQRGGNLGERIAAAHTDTATLLPDTPVLQIGMDTPQVDVDLLDHCRKELTRAGTDAVLGQALDGGWWALGLREPAKAWTIADVPTSRADTGLRTGQALRRAGLNVTALLSVSDVDTMADAVRVAAAAPDSHFAAAVRELL